jgi:hypothetical protein
MLSRLRRSNEFGALVTRLTHAGYADPRGTARCWFYLRWFVRSGRMIR